MTRRIYLDWNATAPLRQEARAAMMDALAETGNPSSVHREGRAARHMVEKARERVAMLVGAEPRNVVFTSGGTEANAMALTAGPPTPRLGKAKSERNLDALFVSSIEHASVVAGGPCPGRHVEMIPATPDGVVDLATLERRLAEPRLSESTSPAPALLVSIMAANNETGVIQPIREAAQLVHAAGGLLHVDAVQAAGRIPFNISESEADLVSISAHKIGGPLGVGALVRRSNDLHFAPLLRGGGQERGARGGTENVAGIAGFGAAASAALASLPDDARRMRRLRERLEAGLAAGPAVVFGRDAERLPNTSLFAAPGLRAETALIALDLGGFAVSSGSACSSGKVGRSHVLAAMGVPDRLISGAIRVSTGPTTTENDIDLFLEAWMKLVSGLSADRHGLAA